MNFLISIAFLISSFGFATSGTEGVESIKQNPTVYICRGQSVKVFHTNRNCPGLKRCSSQIETAKAQAAKDKGFKHCQLPACSR